MPKKPVLATSQELEEAEERLTALIKQAQKEASEAVQGTEKKWQDALQNLQKTTDSNKTSAEDSVSAAKSEARDYTEECIKALAENILEKFPPIEEKIEHVAEDAHRELEEADAKLQQLLVDELSGLAAQFDEEMTKTKDEFNNKLMMWGRQAAEALVTQKKQLEAAIEKLRLSCEEDRTRIREETRQEFERFRENQQKKDDEQDKVRESQRNEIYAEFNRTVELIEAKEAKAALESQGVSDLAAAKLASLANENGRHLAQLDKECQDVRNGMREVENVSTRRVEWVIKQASQMLRPPPGGWSEDQHHRSWFSPQFNGAGAYGMQLELVLYGPPGHPGSAAHQDERNSGTGNVGVFLWACKGARLLVKLYAGVRAKQLEKKFDGRSPCGTNRFCWLRDQINKADDTLRVGVEFLEAMMDVEYPLKLAPYPVHPERAMKSVDGVMKAIDALDGMEDEEAEPDDGSLRGSICCMRHLNNRVLDQVQREVKGMESRMVRKIDWLVQHASKLRQYFPWGEAICSPRFNAAGVEGLQFALYPCGYGPEMNDGFCSLFLYAPAGATLHCYLSIGKQAREIIHHFDESGAYGRTNFCIFDKVLDLVDDTILITLDIEDAKQEISTPWGHKESAVAKDLQSIVKLTKNPGKTPCGGPNGRTGKLDQVMQLPSIWTPKAFVEAEGHGNAGIPEGFHTFDEVLARRPLPVRPDSSDQKGKVVLPAVRGMRKTDSAPDLKDSVGRTAMQQDLLPTSPFSAGASPAKGWDTELPGGAGSLGQARKTGARRQRPSSATGRSAMGVTT